MSVLDYLSDFICVLYGTPGAYGVVTMPFGVREGKSGYNRVRYFWGRVPYFNSSEADDGSIRSGHTVLLGFGSKNIVSSLVRYDRL